MLPTNPHRPPPDPWPQYRSRARHRWQVPFYGFEWICAQAAHRLAKWSFLEVLDYAGRFTVLVAVIFYFAETHDRTMQRHYQAWLVINTAQGKGGSGGRIDALQDLNDDNVALVGVDLSDAFLQRVRLEKADVRRSSFQGCDLLGSHLRAANLSQSRLDHANLREADLNGADLSECAFTDADLSGADLSNCNVRGASFSHCDLGGADLHDLRDWRSISSMSGAQIAGVRNAPDGFLEWAAKNGAVSGATTQP